MCVWSIKCTSSGVYKWSINPISNPYPVYKWRTSKSWHYIKYFCLYYLYYEGESVNRSQMDIKRTRKTCDIRTWKKHLFPDVSSISWYTCPIASPVRRDPQHRSLVAVVSATSAPPFQPLCHQRNVCHPVMNRLTRQTLPSVNRKHFFINIVYIEFVCPQKNAQQNTVLRYYTSQARSPFWLLKPASEHAHARLLPRLSWTGLCCYIVVHIENLLRPFAAVLLPFVTDLQTLPVVPLLLTNRRPFLGFLCPSKQISI
jgi:hypothetical protein